MKVKTNEKKAYRVVIRHTYKAVVWTDGDEQDAMDIAHEMRVNDEIELEEETDAIEVDPDDLEAQP